MAYILEHKLAPPPYLKMIKFFFLSKQDDFWGLAGPFLTFGWFLVGSPLSNVQNVGTVKYMYLYYKYR